MTDAQGHIQRSTMPGQQERQIKRFSQVYEERKVSVINDIIMMPKGAPPRAMTFTQSALQKRQARCAEAENQE